MNFYWVQWRARSGGCFDAPNEADARRQAKELEPQNEIMSCKILPYPADPRLSKTLSDCPSFCYSPDICGGRTSCPKRYACSE